LEAVLAVWFLEGQDVKTPPAFLAVEAGDPTRICAFPVRSGIGRHLESDFPLDDVGGGINLSRDTDIGCIALRNEEARIIIFGRHSTGMGDHTPGLGKQFFMGWNPK